MAVQGSRYVVSRTDDELLDGAKAIAREMSLPGGGKAKLARVIDGHLGWFDAARQRGFEWSDIVRLLFNEGVTRPDGRPLSRGHLSSLVWRKQSERRTNAKPTKSEASVAQRGGRGDTIRRTRSPEKLPLPEPDVRVASPKQAKAPLEAARSGSTEEPVSASPESGQDVLAYMRRAARLRGK